MKLISSILFLIIAIILFFVFVDPLYGEVRQLRTDVSTYNTALNNSIELQKTRDSLIDKYKGIKTEDKDRLVHLLPSDIGNIKLILEIEKIANLHGMPIGNIKFEMKNSESKDMTNNTNNPNNMVVAESGPADYLPYGIFPVEFTIDGKYDTFIAFLKDLEHNLRLVDIKSISFTVPPPVSASEKTIDPDVYSYTLKIETYWLK